MHNIDGMHQEHNVAEIIISTCMDNMGKIKDNDKAQRDLAEICNRPTLELTESGDKLCAPFFLKLKDKKEVLRWMKKLKFSDGYAAGLKRCVNVMAKKFNGLKNHVYHIIMERVMSVMLCGYFDNDVWKALAKLSYFYRQICTMEKLEKEISMLICKLKKKFSKVVQSDATYSCSSFI
jgi:hypothetical protein